MLRIIFASILIIHGLLHLIGVSKGWNIGSHGQLSDKTLLNFSGSTSKITGTVWLLASVLFLSGAAGFILRKEWYWIPAGVALIISQVLIIMDWQDAKYGTIVNIAILIALVFSTAAMNFDRKVQVEVDSIRSQAMKYDRIIPEEMVSTLPKNVQRWMHESNVVGKKTPNLIRVHQKGSMRTKPGSRCMPFEAIQYFSIDPPAFVWSAKIKAAPLVTIAGRDKYQNGKGNMVIKPLYVFTAADSWGEEINEGTLLRFLAEMACFPQPAASKYLRWEFIDDHQARVTMEYGGTTASGTYFFNDDGSVAGFEALRYGDFDGAYRKEKWSVVATGHNILNGIVIGNENEVTWKMIEGDFKWLKVEMIAID